MARSMKLGHCVCDPKKPCPCPVFTEHDVCLCAGEKLKTPTGPVRLTKLAEKAGCASKIDQAFLRKTLNSLPSFDHPSVLLGMPAADDAGVYDLGNATALVQTVDVFTPSVDDAYDFGRIAAANSLSDIYAMGARPITALSIVGFPVGKVADHVLSDILTGGIDVMKKADVPVIGGHSINDLDIKAGFAVTGLVEKDNIITNSGAKPDDLLILTKPLGVGIIAFAGQIDRASPRSLSAACESMVSLNKTAAELMLKHRVNAATDVTGFSLMGHLAEMACAAGVDVEITWDQLPLLPDVLQYVAQGILPGAIERNKESCASAVIAGQGVPEAVIDMCFDPQTSGGLLMAADPDIAQALLEDLHENNVESAVVIGRVTSSGNGSIFVRTNHSKAFKAG